MFTHNIKKHIYTDKASSAGRVINVMGHVMKPGALGEVSFSPSHLLTFSDVQITLSSSQAV